MVKEKLCENVVEVRRRCDRVMAIGLVFGEEVVRVICAYAPRSGKPDSEKERFYEEMAREWRMANANEMVLRLGDFNGHVGKCEGFEGIHGGLPRYLLQIDLKVESYMPTSRLLSLLRGSHLKLLRLT